MPGSLKSPSAKEIRSPLLSQDQRDGEDPPKEKKKKSTRGFWDIYRFADKLDMLLVAMGFFFAIGNGCIQPLLAVVLGQVFQPPVTSEQIQETILNYMLPIGGAAFCMNCGQYCCFMISGERIIKRLKTRLFTQILEQELGYFDVNKSGTLAASVAEQTNLILAGTTDKFGMAVMGSAQFVVGFGIAYYYNWQIAGIMTGCMPAVAILLGGFIILSVRYVKQATAAYEDAGGVAEEVLGNMQTVAAFGGEERSCTRYDVTLLIAEKAGIKRGLVQGIGLGLVLSTIYLFFGVGFFFGSSYIADGITDVGSVLTTVYACLMGSAALGLLAPNLSAIAQAKAGAEAVYEVLDRPMLIDRHAPGQDSPPRGGAALVGEIRFAKVTFRYPARLENVTLNALTLTIEAGESCALVGASGCGKSTCIQLLQRFYDVESGRVLVDGVDVRQYNLNYLRGQMGLVSQEPVLFDTSIAANIAYGKPGASMEEIVQACKHSNCHDFIMGFPDEYQTLVGNRGGKLSGGQKQRIAIARALIRDPAIILLDEATSALDNESERVVQAAIDAMLARRRRTTIVIAHRLTTVAGCDKIAVLDNDGSGGNVVEIGTHAELMKMPEGAYRQLVTMQGAASSTKTKKKKQKKKEDRATAPPSQLVRKMSSKYLKGSPSLERLSSLGTDAAQGPRGSGSLASTSLLGGDDYATGAPGSSSVGSNHSASGGGQIWPSAKEMGITDQLVAPLLTSMAGSGIASPARSSTKPGTRLSRARSTASYGDDLNDYGMNSGMVSPLLSSAISFNGSFGGKKGGGGGRDIEAAGEINMDPDVMYDVPTSRVWAMSRPEMWWFALGLLGSMIKGAAQPTSALIMSHILTNLILIPGFNCQPSGSILPDMDPGVAPNNCTYSSPTNCFPLASASLESYGIFPSEPNITGLCTAPCESDSQCSGGEGMCYSATEGTPASCVYQWADGYDPDAVNRQGIVALVFYICLGFSLATGIAMQIYSFAVIGERLTLRLRSLVFRSLVRQSSEFFDDKNNSVGTLLTRLATDATLVKRTTADYTGILFENATCIAVACAIAFYSSWEMAIVVIAPMPLLIWCIMFQKRLNMGLNKVGLEALEDSGKVVAESIAGVRTVQSFSAEHKVSELYGEALMVPKLMGVRNGFICGIGAGTSQMLFFMVYAFGFWYAGKLLEEARIDIANLSRVFFAITATAQAIGTTGAQMSDWTRAIIATSNIFKLADSRPAIDPTNERRGKRSKGRVRGEIVFENVTFRYPSRADLPVLTDLCVRVNAGDTVAFVGASGSGKSSIIRLVCRFYDPENFHSRILVDGVDLRDINIKWWRSQVGLVGQEPILFGGSIADNIAWGKDGVTPEEIRAAALSANAHGFIESFPGGYDTDVGGQGAQLSGGQKQRIAIARALVRDPVVLLLDEATSALDNESEAVVQAALDKLVETARRTTLVVAHRLSTIQGSDKIVVLDNDGSGGAVVEEGSHAELMEIEGGSYRHLQSMTVRT